MMQHFPGRHCSAHNFGYQILAGLLLFISGGCVQQPYTVPDAADQFRIVNTGMLNLRDCPSTDCRIITVLKRGTRCRVMQEKNGWTRLYLENNDTTGWAASRYLSRAAAAPPVHGTDRIRTAPPRIPDEEFAMPGSSTGGRQNTEHARQPDKTAVPDISIEEEFAQ